MAQPPVDRIINFKLVLVIPKPKPKPIITALFIPLFILAYSLSEHHFVLGSPISPLNDALSKRQNAPPIPLPPSPPPLSGGNTPTATWTYNYWWPYPPAGAVTATAIFPSSPPLTPPVPVPPTQTVSQDHVTLVLPITTTTTAQSFDQDQITATDSTTTNASSTSSTSPSPNNPNENSNSQSQSQALTSTPHPTLLRPILYLIPLFIVLALFILGSLIWLIWGCCTRKPKYRYRYRRGGRSGGEVLSVSRPYPLPPSPGSRVGGVNWLEDDDENGGDNGKMGGGSQATFRAFRYEDLPLPHDASFSYDDDPWDGDDANEKIEEETVTTKCRHSREYGFRCDCRLSVVEREEVRRFRWPGVLPDVNEEEEEEESEGGEREGRGRKGGDDGGCGGKGRERGRGRGGTFTPLDNLSPSSSTAIISPSSADTVTELKSPDGYFDVDVDGDVTSTLGKQNKLLETLGLHLHQQQRDAPKFGGKIMSRKSRRKLLKAKSTKSTKSTKTGRSSRTGTGKWTVGSVYSVDDVQDAEVDDEDTEGGEGFRMIVESPPPVPNKPQRRAREDHGAPEETETGASVGWMGKVANAFSRRGRNGGTGAGGIVGDADAAGEGEGEDRYTALPSPSTSPSTRTAGKRVTSNRSHLRRSTRRQSSRVDHSDTALTRHGMHEQDEDEDMGGLAPDEMTEDELARQRRRLQHHRASIASLPKGMVYSPPLVQGVGMFCDGNESSGGGATGGVTSTRK